MNARYLLFVAPVLLALTTSAYADSNAVKLRRFAYIIGANDGGAERVKLRYAGTDAAKVAELMRDLGGVASGDVIVKNAISIRDIESGFTELVPKLKAARRPGVRVELVIYYSGHSDERGLLVGESRLDYSALRARVSAMPADVNIAILDSCASGAFTRTKGGKREPAFLIDESSKVTGYAFISSSSADEVAQESDRISASFFTHYLISGLRGGADANRDGRVTLNEAYQFAFAETVARTESTVGGAQHPAYNMHLAGTGDVVMTDLRATSASLVVDKQVRGRLFIRDANDNLVVELNKIGRHPVELGLNPGRYTVTLKTGGKLYRASVKLSGNRRSTLSLSAFEGARLENATARGDGPPGETPADGYADEKFRVSFTPHVSVGGGNAEKTRLRFSLNILAGRGDALEGVEIGGLVNIMHDDVRGAQVAGIANIVGGSSRGVRVAGIGNYSGGSQHGVLVGGVFNASRGGGSGVSGAGIINYVGDDFRGTQIAGTANASMGNMRGLQVAGVGNVAYGHLEGIQVSGGVNIAASVRGTQIGVLNSAGRVDGLQIGIVNVAKEADASIGVVNIIGDGYRTAEAWTSDTGVANVGVKLGARHTYSILAAGADNDRYHFGGGLGIHRPFGRAYLDVDLMAFTLFNQNFGNLKLDLLTKLRAAIGYALTPNIALFGGPTATGALYFDFEEEEEVVDITFFGAREFNKNTTLFRLTPGLFAGVRFTL